MEPTVPTHSSSILQAFQGKRPFYRRELILIGLCIIALISFSIWISGRPQPIKQNNNPQVVAPVITATPTPADYPNYYLRRNYTPEKVATEHPAEWLTKLSAVPDADLLGIRCTQRLVNENKNFFVRSFSDHSPKIQVVDPKLVALLNDAHYSTEEPLQVLRAKVCETDDGHILLEYHEGVQAGEHPDAGTDMTLRLSYLTQNQSFMPGFAVVEKSFWSSPGCISPFMITKSHVMYYACSIQDGTSFDVRYYQIDLQTKNITPVLTCRIAYDASGKSIRNCK